MSGIPARVYRDYDQAALDRQYNSQGKVSDYTIYLRQYAERSRAARDALACIDNLHYGEHPDETLDFYPCGKSGAPVHVFLHGGDWRALSKDDSGFAAPAFVAAGAAFVAVNFSPVPVTTVTGMGAQVRRALAWLWQNAAAHGGDPQRIYVCGHSSGANLVTQLLTTDWARDFGTPPQIIKGAVLISGLGDLEPVRLSFRNRNLHLDENMVNEVSLLRRVPGLRCPLIVAFGDGENEDYKRQSRDIARYWSGHGNAVALFELVGRNHYDAVLEWAEPASAIFRANCKMMAL